MSFAAGKFITFEGGEGSGKSTQASLLAESFAAAGIKAVKTREPGGTTVGEKIREILVTGKSDSLSPVSEALLNFAARFEHVEKLIKPELAGGHYVICDRFTDSTLAYQGFGHGLGSHYIGMLQNLIIGNFKPDLTFLLDIEVEKGLARANSRAGSENRFEGMTIDFHTRLQQGFKKIAKEDPARFCVIDGSQSKEIIHEKIIAEINKRFALKLV